MPSDDESKQDLLSTVRKERAKLDEVFSSMDDPTMLAAARDDGWTAKDLLAHITVWERRLLTWIERWRATGRPERPEPGVAWDAGDLLNDRDYARAKGRPLADVRREADASHEAVLRAIEALNDDELAVRSEGSDGPTWAWIIGANTYEHYHEHREEIEAWLQAHR